MSGSSCKRVLHLSCERSFPPVFPVFMFFSEILLGCMNFVIIRITMRWIWVNCKFSSFYVKTLFVFDKNF